jgi:hypothetical protein
LEPHVAGGVHVAPLHVPRGQSPSWLQLDRPHLAPLHDWLTGHAASPAQLTRLHVEPLQRLLTLQALSVPHDFDLQVAPVQSPSAVPQSPSTEHVPATHMPS